MDELRRLSSEPNAALVILTFLQADCNVRDLEYSEELFYLSSELTVNRGTNCNAFRIPALDDGDLECDGHLPNSLTICLDDILPSVDLHRNHAEAAAIQQVAEELRVIAAQLEHNVVAQATQNLRRNIASAQFFQWSYYLNREVESVMSAMQGVVGLETLPQERVVLALTLTLVKGVCQQAPQLLRRLFYTVLQYITSSSRHR